MVPDPFTIRVVLAKCLPGIAILFCLISCSPIPYANVGVNTPMFKNKGEVNINAAYANTEDTEGFALQAGVAVDSSIAIITSFYSLVNLPDSYFEGRGRYFELGVGLFGKDRKRGRFIRDAFIGCGTAGIENQYEQEHLDVNFIKPFLQGSLGFSSAYFDVEVTSRFALVYFNSEDYAFVEPANMMSARTFFEDNNGRFIWEPAITLRGGLRDVKLQLQYSVSTFTTDDYNVNINQDFLSIGLNVLISNRYQNRASKTK